MCRYRNLMKSSGLSTDPRGMPDRVAVICKALDAYFLVPNTSLNLTKALEIRWHGVSGRWFHDSATPPSHKLKVLIITLLRVCSSLFSRLVSFSTAFKEARNWEPAEMRAQVPHWMKLFFFFSLSLSLSLTSL